MLLRTESVRWTTADLFLAILKHSLLQVGVHRCGSRPSTLWISILIKRHPPGSVLIIEAAVRRRLPDTPLHTFLPHGCRCVIGRPNEFLRGADPHRQGRAPLPPHRSVAYEARRLMNKAMLK